MKQKLNTKIIRMVRPLFMIMLLSLLLVQSTYSWIRRDTYWHAALNGQDVTLTAESGIPSLSAEIIFQASDLQNFGPGTPVPFTIQLTNTSDEDMKVSLSIAEMTVSDPALLEVVYISLGDGADGASEVDYCLNQATAIGSAEDKAYSLSLYTGKKALTVPGNGFVELDGSLYFDSNAGTQYQNVSLQIKWFRLVKV